jgi:anthranilate phosphoribosyltransferase
LDLKEALIAVSGAETLSRDDARAAMTLVMNGEATPAQLGGLLAVMHLRGETVEEIAGFASALRDAAVKVHAPPDAIDTCGTGGDRSNSFNISTVSAIVASAAGARIAKHGNRAASSACGSADVLEELGVAIDLGPADVATCLDEVGFGFMFAPRYHPAMRHAAPVRRELGIRTIFNILGPLTNPAGAQCHVMGVPNVALAEKMAHALARLGMRHALVVSAEDGLDDISVPRRCSRLRATLSRSAR